MKGIKKRSIGVLVLALLLTCVVLQGTALADVPTAPSSITLGNYLLEVYLGYTGTGENRWDKVPDSDIKYVSANNYSITAAKEDYTHICFIMVRRSTYTNTYYINGRELTPESSFVNRYYDSNGNAATAGQTVAATATNRIYYIQVGDTMELRNLYYTTSGLNDYTNVYYTINWVDSTPAAPSTSYNMETEKFSNLNTTHEISFNGGAYTPVTSSIINNGVTPYIDQLATGATGTLRVRVAASGSTPAGNIKTLTIYSRAAVPSGLSYDANTCEVSGMSSNMSYRIVGDTTWIKYTSGSGTLDVSELLSSTEVKALEVRYNYVTGTSSASLPAEVVLSQLSAAPELSIDYANEAITGFESGLSYDYKSSGSQWTPAQLIDNEFSFADLAEASLAIRESATASSSPSAAATITIPARPSAPDVSFVYDNPDYPNQAVLMGLDSSMEYRLSGDTDWISATDDDTVFDLPESQEEYEVRFKGTANARPSQMASITLSGFTVQGTDMQSDVALGGAFVMAIADDGTVWTWGNNYNGQLGDGTTTNSAIPKRVNNLSGIVSVTADSNTAYALKDDGTVWTWGKNDYGQLGNGTTVNSTRPVQVTGLTDIVAIEAGDNFCVALKADGTVWTWGINSNGQLGIGSLTSSSVAVKVSNIPTVVYISAGGYHAHVICADGTVYGWGANGGRLGDGGSDGQTSPIRISALDGVKKIVDGQNHMLALDEDGYVWTSGFNNYGQLGDGSAVTQYTPVRLTTISNVVDIAVGTNHSLAVLDSGEVRAWGSNPYGQLGIGNTTNQPTPTAIPSLTNERPKLRQQQKA